MEIYNQTCIHLTRLNIYQWDQKWAE